MSNGYLHTLLELLTIVLEFHNEPMNFTVKGLQCSKLYHVHYTAMYTAMYTEMVRPLHTCMGETSCEIKGGSQVMAAMIMIITAIIKIYFH